MDDQEFEDMLKRVFNQDFSADTEEFRDALLARCLAEISQEDNVIELDDSDLGLLAAAGTTSCLTKPEQQKRPDGRFT